jgi:hypothetical protein
MNVTGKIRQKFTHRLVLKYIFDRLAEVGFKVMPYYLVQEGLVNEEELEINPKLELCFSSVLEPSDIEATCAKPEVSFAVGQIQESVAMGCQCFGIRYNGDIAAYMWYNLRECHPLSLPLGEDEAYLFNAYTFKEYRGKNLAPYLRYQLYQHLESIGRTRLYSITEFFNTSAIKFKKKLKVRSLRLCLLIGLFKRYEWNIPLKNYNAGKGSI